ncbi:hypothetical protein C9374_009595 [Naegleria lovaniensis]|uniref:UBX domain-containing protein n=1 Tax=Naegleria lovaniensis TaxID=51637 RepID=A0AA88GXV0_NAELO|nr:uncharacterized protein C9374_009595 [Naegleria lovaniensis]KAG2393018.1 hypothetical protein C9374_009595 [Naegleria lovaniensis]
MSSVIITGLNMRSVIKIDGPNTSLQTILKDFCEKNKISPENYGLMHNKKNLDLSLPFRLSGVSNNATIEIVKKASSSQVKAAATLGLQLPDGQRLKAVFPVDISLWIALKRWEKKEENINLTQVEDEKTKKYSIPSLIYMNQQFKTLEELKNTKLSDIGLRDNSNALLRLSFLPTDKTIEDLKEELQESDDYVPKKKVSKTNTEQSSTTSEAPPASSSSEDVQMIDESPSLQTNKIETSPTSSDIMQDDEEEIKLENTVAKDIRLFKKGDTTFDIDFSNVEDKDFEVTENDVQSMISSLRKVQEGGPLMTKQLREKENQKHERVYTSAIIRVRFPDGYLIQGTFSPNHTLRDVRNFVIQTLDNPEAPIVLYIAPPIQRFDDLTKTLKESNLIPAAIINVGLDRKDPKSALFESPKLKEDLLAKVTDLELVSVPKNENIQKPTSQASSSQKNSEKSKAKMSSLLAHLTKKK